jgi:DNA-binding transcriptional regulator YiaG
MFTPEELAEMAAADAEIEEKFALTNEDLSLSRDLDRAAQLEDMSTAQRKLAEYKRAYYEANRDKVAEYKRAYYEANRDKVAEYQRAYYEANRDKVAERQRAYREANRDKVAERQRAYREANRDKVAERQRAYREANRDKLAERQRAIATARQALGLTQAHIARMLGVSQATVCLWESGQLGADWDALTAVLPGLAELNKKRAAHGGNDTEDGKGNNTMCHCTRERSRCQ